MPDTVLDALCDDLNTPRALSAMHAFADAALAGDASAAADLLASGHLIGLLTQAPDAWFRGGTEDADAIEVAVQERLDARKARNFARADAIRADLAERGIVLEDGPGGTTWRRAG